MDVQSTLRVNKNLSADKRKYLQIENVDHNLLNLNP